MILQVVGHGSGNNPNSTLEDINMPHRNERTSETENEISDTISYLLQEMEGLRAKLAVQDSRLAAQEAELDALKRSVLDALKRRVSPDRQRRKDMQEIKSSPRVYTFYNELLNKLYYKFFGANVSPSLDVEITTGRGVRKTQYIAAGAAAAGEFPGGTAAAAGFSVGAMVLEDRQKKSKREQISHFITMKPHAKAEKIAREMSKRYMEQLHCLDCNDEAKKLAGWTYREIANIIEKNQESLDETRTLDLISYLSRLSHKNSEPNYSVTLVSQIRPYIGGTTQWDTGGIYKKPGIKINGDDNYTYYSAAPLNPTCYFFRLARQNEIPNEIFENGSVERGEIANPLEEIAHAQ